jgi:Flp pilus assembly protein TadD
MRHHRFILLAILVIAVVALVSCARPNDPQAHLKAGKAALEKGDTATAIRELETVTGADPRLVEARVLLARAYEKADRRDDAIGQYQAALLLQYQDAEVGYHLGALLVSAGQPADAAAPLAMGVKLSPGMAISFTKEISAAVAAGLAAGNAHVSAGQPQEAIEQYQAVLALAPNNASAITNLGAAYYQMGKLDQAIAQYQAALQLTPDDAETHYLLGAAYIQQNQVAKAQSEFQTALKSNPNLAPAYIGLGNAQLLQSDLEGAVSSLTKATQLAPNSPEALYALGKVFMAKGDVAGARKAFQQFLTLNPPPNRRAEVEQWLKQLGP